jgi:hypothetical protein
MKRRLPGPSAQLCPHYRFTPFIGRPLATAGYAALADGYRNITGNETGNNTRNNTRNNTQQNKQLSVVVDGVAGLQD